MLYTSKKNQYSSETTRKYTVFWNHTIDSFRFRRNNRQKCKTPLLINMNELYIKYFFITMNKSDIQPVEYISSFTRITMAESHNALCNRLWRHHKNENRASETPVRYVKMWRSSFMDSLYRVKYQRRYVLSQWTVYALTLVLFYCLFLVLSRNLRSR